MPCRTFVWTLRTFPIYFQFRAGPFAVVGVHTLTTGQEIFVFKYLHSIETEDRTRIVVFALKVLNDLVNAALFQNRVLDGSFVFKSLTASSFFGGAADKGGGGALLLFLLARLGCCFRMTLEGLGRLMEVFLFFWTEGDGGD